MGPAASQTQGYGLRDAKDRGLRRMVTMDTDDRFFDLNPQTRYSGFVDVKPGKINYYRRKIAEKDSIEPVELHIFGDDEFRISDGRHRIYALHDAGFTVVKATVFLEEDMTPDFQKSVDEVIKKISP